MRARPDLVPLAKDLGAVGLPVREEMLRSQEVCTCVCVCLCMCVHVGMVFVCGLKCYGL